MRKINVSKVERLRKNLHLNQGYLEDLLRLGHSGYVSFMQGETELNLRQVELLAKALGTEPSYLFEEDIIDDKVFARTDVELSEHDKRQIAEFKEFQKFLGKKSAKELVFH
ncbi:helix-turn-helix domain-containing protein [Bacillus haynesii]|uniref:helix-turn-helix domain-containing protein n=1 Tax=Bacillus haynesii TaxID=1925021 RepID=UPI0035E03FD2